MFAIYHCIINWSKSKCLKTTFIIFQCLEVRNLCMLWLLWLRMPQDHNEGVESNAEYTANLHMYQEHDLMSCGVALYHLWTRRYPQSLCHISIFKEQFKRKLTYQCNAAVIIFYKILRTDKPLKLPYSVCFFLKKQQVSPIILSF